MEFSSGEWIPSSKFCIKLEIVNFSLKYKCPISRRNLCCRGNFDELVLLSMHKIIKRDKFSCSFER